MQVASGKDVSDEVRALGTTVEEGVNSIQANAHQKVVYKRFTFDFFKSEGGYMEKVNLSLPKGSGGPRKKGSKLQIVSFIVNIGDTAKLDYTIEEESRSYDYSITLASGDAFAITSEVKGVAYGLSELVPKSTPKGIVLREGSLIVTVESN
jgi:hypothetical protein